MIVGLGVSRFLISIGGLFLALNWLAEGGFHEKYRRLKSNTPALLVLGLFVLHVIWLWNTSNFEYASKDIRIKLPLLLLPVVIGSGRPIDLKHIIRLLWLLLAALLLGTMLAIGHYFTAHNAHVDNIREIIFFSSPIRFSLMLVLGVAVTFYFLITNRISWWAFALINLWILGFIVFLQSVTGVLMLVTLIAVLSIYFGWKHVSGYRSLAWIGLPVAIVVLLSAAVVKGFYDYRTPLETAENSPPFDTHSVGGEFYKHELENTELENGTYIYRYVAVLELERAWNRKSTIEFMSTDHRGQRLRFTLMRYMSSMGLRKDSVGFAQLSADDIRRIEQGYTTAYPKQNPLLKRLYATYYEVNAYLNGASVQGSSLIQHMVYMRTGWQVARENWLMGVGTGDVNDAILTQYESNQSLLDMDFRRRAHNQYLTFLISFGILGALYFLIFVGWSIRWAFRHADFLAMVFIVLAACSFLSEDTLETQVGATFFAFFYTFFFCQKIASSTTEDFRFDELWGNSINGRLDK